jgi:hypothetical protein
VTLEGEAKVERRIGAAGRLVAVAALALAGVASAEDVPEPPLGSAIHALRPPAPEDVEPCTCSEQCARRDGYGSVCEEGRCKPYVDRWDLLGMIGMASKPDPPPFKLLPAVFPAIGYNPALGALIGVSGTLAMYLGQREDTTISNLSGVALITSNRQIIVQLASTVMTSRNEWSLVGDWRFLVYNQATYGLGTGPSAFGEKQPMDFDMLRFHETVYRRVWGNLYLGGGWAFDRFFAVQDQNLDTSSTPAVITPAYAYSLNYGFDPSAQTVSGVALAALYDSRDSTINPYRGLYANLTLYGLPTWLGSTQSSLVLHAEFRAYVGMDVEVPRNVLAFWAYFKGVPAGALPYLALPSLGWDARNRTGRGYIQGRFRGTQQAYAEVEWRFRITNNGLLGGVLFANASSFGAPGFTVNGPGWSYTETRQPILKYVQPAAGFGLRFMMNRESRTNVTLDFGFGNEYFGIWLNAGEYF